MQYEQQRLDMLKTIMHIRSCRLPDIKTMIYTRAWWNFNRILCNLSDTDHNYIANVICQIFFRIAWTIIFNYNVVHK